MKNLLEQTHQLLKNGHPLVLATVIRHSGSTPRGAGAKMIVRKDGSIIGTIGGGVVEADVIRSAVELFRSGGAIICRFDFNSTNAAGAMGMICGGDMDVLLECLDPADSYTLDVFGKAASELQSGTKSFLVKWFPADADRFHSETFHCHFVTGTSGALENFPMDVTAFEGLMDATFSQRRLASHISGKHMIVVDPLFSSDYVYLFGAGHISQKLAGFLSMVDFQTIVIDDRSEFANRALFPAASEIWVPQSFASAFSPLSIVRRDALVILTRGHAHDQTVLEQALETDAGYIGMIGSRKKRDVIYANLERKGVSREALERVHSPVGIDIGARTPEEIALCIAAQLVAYRAGRM